MHELCHISKHFINTMKYNVFLLFMGTDDDGRFLYKVSLISNIG
ncbi:hypothetical protein CSC17_4586 [Klebsiella oxytoca]|nr:hypothetical protein CSC17_4586 [Klebsiella oxytoca]EUC86951.1 hypothetical protein HMPREF1570_3334 [Klebsiella oxytoca KA-2]EUC90000.1 hypothetical protein HMPREF1569_2193 [Klebsiella oxytoca OK-1]